MSSASDFGPRAIIIGHEAFAEGMRSAVQRITGRGDALIPISSQELSLPQIVDTLRDTLASTGVVVIFTDLAAGSASMAARKVLHDSPEAILVAGANLAMLLDFVLSHAPTAIEAAKHAADRGRAAISVHGGAGAA